MLDFPRWKILTVLAVCVFFALGALPNILPQEIRENWPSALPNDTISLGLDLQGGSHLLLRLEMDEYLRDRFEATRDGLRDVMREDRLGYRNLLASKNQVSFTLRPETIREDTDIPALIRKVDPNLSYDEESDTYRIYYDDEQLRKIQLQVLEQSIEIVNRRINETGTKEPIIQRQGDERILVQVPGLQDPEQLKSLLGKTAKMTFHLVDESVSDSQLIQGIVSPGTRLLPNQDGIGRTAIYSKVSLGGEAITGANPGFDAGQPVVNFQMDARGARIFGEITQSHIGKRFAIVLDGKVITAPVIRGAILGGSGQISGNFTTESANELAILLRAGALPAPLTIIEERTVGPSLGADSIAAGKLAAVAAIVVVIVYMMVAYNLFGVFSAVALAVNMIILLAALSLLGATLTLPGIAGIVLTLGMAVDANVLIYERIKEEMRKGKGIRAAIDSGFKSAWGTIVDSNVTTLIAAVILFAFGTGTVKGFAVTLSLGILSSMFTAIMLTRLMVVVWFRKAKPTKLPI